MSEMVRMQCIGPIVHRYGSINMELTKLNLVSQPYHKDVAEVVIAFTP